MQITYVVPDSKTKAYNVFWENKLEVETWVGPNCVGFFIYILQNDIIKRGIIITKFIANSRLKVLIWELLHRVVL